MKNWLINHRYAILAVAVGLVFFYASEFDTRASSLAACERANASRTAQVYLADSLILVNERRIAAAGSSPTERAANKYALRRYRESKQRLIEAQESVAIARGSVIADCGRSYPAPWPFG